MLGLGAGVSQAGYPSAVGGWRAATVDVEAEIVNLRTIVETSQRSQLQLESKLFGRLEELCRRHVTEALSGEGPLQEFRQTLSRVQNECRHVGTEINRLPNARDVDAALEKNRAALESHLSERLGNIEESVERAQKATLSRMESRGGETWRGCLQRMADLEQKAVLQGDVAGIVDKAVLEVRKAGPDLFGAGAVSGPAALAETRTALRRVEAKVAGCEARLLGIAEDSTAEGRIWRASTAARIDRVEHVQQDMGGRLASCEAGKLAAEVAADRLSEAIETAQEKTQGLISEAEERAAEAAAQASADAEAVIKEQVDALNSQVQSAEAAMRRELGAFELRLQALEHDLRVSKKDNEGAVRESSLAKDGLEEIRAEIASLGSKVGVGTAAAQEATQHELQRGLTELRFGLRKQLAALEGVVEAQNSRHAATLNALEQRHAAGEQRLLDLMGSVSRVEAMEKDLSQAAVAATAAAQAAAIAAPQGQADSHARAAVSAAGEGTQQAARAVPQALVSPAAAAVAAVTRSPAGRLATTPAAAGARGTPTAAVGASPAASAVTSRAVPPSPAGTVRPSPAGTPPGSVQAAADVDMAQAGSAGQSRMGSATQSRAASALPSPRASTSPVEATKSPAVATPAAKSPSGGSAASQPQGQKTPTAAATAGGAAQVEAEQANQAAQGTQPAQTQPSSGTTPPPLLQLASPNFQQECAGEYELLQETANGQPLWQKRAGERWLYCNTEGCWIVGGPTERERGFQCTNGYILNNRPHSGVTPDLLGPGWLVFDGAQWREDNEVRAVAAAVAATSPPPRPADPSASQAQGGSQGQAQGQVTPGQGQAAQGAPASSGPASTAHASQDGNALADSILQGVGDLDSWDGDTPTPELPDGSAPAGATVAGGQQEDSWDAEVLQAALPRPAAEAATAAAAEAALEDSWDRESGSHALPSARPAQGQGQGRGASESWDKQTPTNARPASGSARQQADAAALAEVGLDDSWDRESGSQGPPSARPAQGQVQGRTAEDSWDRESLSQTRQTPTNARPAAAAGRQQAPAQELEDSWDADSAADLPVSQPSTQARPKVPSPAVGIGRAGATASPAPAASPQRSESPQDEGGSWDDDDDLPLEGFAAPAAKPAAKPVAKPAAVATKAAAKPAAVPKQAPAAQAKTPPASARHMADLGFDSDEEPVRSDAEEENSWD